MKDKLDKDLSNDRSLNTMVEEKTELIQEEVTLEGVESNDSIENVNNVVEEENNMNSEEMEQAKEVRDSIKKHLFQTLKLEEDDEEQNSLHVPTGIDKLDVILGGGVLTGFVEMVGPPGGGKSAFSGKLISSFQKNYPKSIVIYLDSECSMTLARLKQLGARSDAIIYSDFTVEKVFDIIEGICAYKEEHSDILNIPSLIVWDSIANTLTDKAMESKEVKETLGQKAALFTLMLPKFVKKLKKYNIVLFGINQLRDKIEIGGGYVKVINYLKYLGDKNIPGGAAHLHNAIQLLLLKHGSELKEEYGFNGNRVKLIAAKNKSFAPNIEIELVLSFRNGFLNFWTNFELLKDNKRIKSGAWCTMLDYDGKSFRQIESLKRYKEDAKFKSVFDQHVQEVLQSEYKTKYDSTCIEDVDS